MNVDRLRRFCMSFPHATESVQWGDHLVFKVAGKVFAIAALEPATVWLSLKSDPNEYADLIERPGIVPAPYLARYQWIALEQEDALAPREVEHLVRRSYELVVEKLPRKARAKVSQTDMKATT